MDPTIWSTILGSPIFGNPYIYIYTYSESLTCSLINEQGLRDLMTLVSETPKSQMALPTSSSARVLEGALFHSIVLYVPCPVGLRCLMP